MSEAKHVTVVIHPQSTAEIRLVIVAPGVAPAGKDSPAAAEVEACEAAAEGAREGAHEVAVEGAAEEAAMGAAEGAAADASKDIVDRALSVCARTAQHLRVKKEIKKSPQANRDAAKKNMMKALQMMAELVKAEQASSSR